MNKFRKRDFIGLILLILIAITWLFPVLAAIWQLNIWIIFIYIIWWMPAILITKIFLFIYEFLDI